jgi:carbamoyl-phosphate synthase small subunit
VKVIAELQKMVGKKPIFGICLGHQLLALAMGAKTGKLPFGHRGANQPVKDLETGRTYITSQNHGYAVLPETLAGVGTLRYVNANDGTCEGVDYPDARAFTVQFHPEACGGPEDTEFLFDRFISLMEGK